MGNISLKLNLAALQGARRKVKGQNGLVDVLIIPVASNHLFEGQNGALYLDLTAFELKEKKEGRNDTHLIKQQLPAEVFKALTEDQKKATPILGNATVWSGDRTPSAAPGSAAANTAVTTPPEGDDGLSDLPF